MSSLLFGLRLSRWGILGFSLAALISTFIQAVGFYQIAGHTPAEHAAFGASMITLSSQFVALFPTPLRPDTVEGYVQFRGFNPLAIIFAVWALASATGFARGDEERGIVESELATGTTRPALVAARAGAFAIGVLVASAAAGAGFVFGVESGGESVPARGLIEACALLAAVGLSAYAISLLVAQLASARAATALAGAFLLALFLVNSLSRVMSSLSTWRWLSPFRYYELSQPLPPGGYFDVRGLERSGGARPLRAQAGTARMEHRDGRARVGFRRPDQDHRAGAALHPHVRPVSLGLRASKALSRRARLHVV
ncbi:MAG: hypothetical protein E6J08_02190 [Chloroflexi bacterium]|nr:MAG: hypothetical protein E6J08_02190 [Chloroflexota bacterium]